MTGRPEQESDRLAANVARGHAQVGQMIGTVGTLFQRDVVHNGPTFYQMRPRTPEQHLDAARLLLDSSAAVTARSEIDAAVAAGLRTTEVGYVRALTIVSGHAFDHLTGRDVDALRECFAWARNDPGSEHAAALSVIDDLLQCHAAQLEGHGIDATRLDAALHRFDALPSPVKENLGRHLDMVLGGATQEGVDASTRRDIEEHRLDRGRRQRVPLFFEPDPCPPLLLEPAPPAAGTGHVLRAAVGVGGGAVALVLLVPVLVGRPPLLAAVLAGLAGVLGWGPQVGYALHRRRAILAEDAWDAATAAGPSPSDPVAAELRQLVRRCYENAVSAEEAPLFMAVTAAARARLERELAVTYGAEPGAPRGLEWLVRHHAGLATASWRAGRSGGRPRVPAVRLVAALLCAAALVGGLLVGEGLLLVRSPPAGALAAAVGLIAALLLPAGPTWYAEQRRVREQEAELRDRADDELAAYDRELLRLRSRPEDADMARWLDFDKDHVRLSAMRRYGLKPTHIVGHVLIVEPAKGCDRARERNGPTRYSAYQVRLFLLTRHGVRQVDVTIDSASGAENGESRNAFRYDAIASARIVESSVHKHGRRQVATPEGGGPVGRLPRPILRQSLELTLVNGQPITIENDFVRALPAEKTEDSIALESLAMDTSGAIGALRTLESVAADGRHWLNREQDRARFHATDYLRRMAAVGDRAGAGGQRG